MPYSQGASVMIWGDSGPNRVRATMGGRGPVGGRKDKAGVCGLNNYESSEFHLYPQ